MITFEQKGNLKNTINFLKNIKKMKNIDYSFLNKYGEEGVQALKEATPKDTGATSRSWYYKIVSDENSISIQWLNSNIIKNTPIAIILQYGHATGTGGYVEGIDYINPAIRPIFNDIEKRFWEEVKNI